MKIKKVLVSLGIAMAMFLNTVCGYAHTNSVDLAEKVQQRPRPLFPHLGRLGG